MKLFGAFLIASLAICVNAGINKDKAKEMATIMLNECKNQERGSDADVESMMSLKYPESAAGLCMIACVHEKMGIVSINADKYLFFLK